MAGKIFINYRRGDDPGNTGRLFDRLQDTFTPDQLFLDVDNIAPGLDFVRVLHECVAECDIILTVIGKGWLDARDVSGARRLDDPNDFVRVEIASALRQDKRVIPVLVGEAQMPRENELPEELRPLARRNAVRLTHERFRADMQGLIKAVQQALEDKTGDHGQSARQRGQGTAAKGALFRPVTLVPGVIAVVLVVAGALFWINGKSAPSPASQPAAIATVPSAPVPATPAPTPAAPPAPAYAPPSQSQPVQTAPANDHPAVITKSIRRDVSLGYMNLRSGPGQDQKILARIPAGSTGVTVTGACMAPKDSASVYPFCPVEWNGLQGWVSSNGLE
jgi:hypothetical protein